MPTTKGNLSHFSSLYAQRDDLDYNLAFIPKDFTAESTSEFDTAYMDALFQLGYQMACCGYPWSKYPPDVNPRKYDQKPTSTVPEKEAVPRAQRQ